MSDAAPAKAQKTGRGDTPHRGGGRGGGFKKHQGGKQQRGGNKARPRSAARPPRRPPRSSLASLAAPHYAARRARQARGPSRDATLTCARRHVPRTPATRRRARQPKMQAHSACAHRLSDAGGLRRQQRGDVEGAVAVFRQAKEQARAVQLACLLQTSTRNCDACLRVRSHAAVACTTGDVAPYSHVQRAAAPVLRRQPAGRRQKARVPGVLDRGTPFPFAWRTKPIQRTRQSCAPPADAWCAVTARVQVFEHMNEKGVVPIEMTYTALARIAGAGGNGARALELVRAA